MTIKTDDLLKLASELKDKPHIEYVDRTESYWMTVGFSGVQNLGNAEQAYKTLQEMIAHQRLLTDRDAIRTADPKCWQDVPWSIFPKQVTWRTLELNPHQFIHAFRDDYGYDMLPAEYMYELEALFGFDYMIEDECGQFFSLGVFYGYPKCCVFEFALHAHSSLAGVDKYHPNARDLTEAFISGKVQDAWILCHTCAEYVAKHGVEKYLSNEAWEKDKS
jgi:hypothetical protein